MEEYWDIPNNFGTSVSEFERYVGRKPRNEEEMGQWVDYLKKGMDAQLDWDVICSCASDNFSEDEEEEEEYGDGEDACILCGETFIIGEDGNELGFCCECQESEGFPYDLDAYYRDYDEGEVVFKGFETMSRGILEPYRKEIIQERKRVSALIEKYGEEYQKDTKVEKIIPEDFMDWLNFYKADVINEGA
jgi:hypothetical protein